MIPEPAVKHYSRMQREQANAALKARRAWRSVDSRYISESLNAALPLLTTAVTAHQLTAAMAGAEYAADTLAAQGMYTAPDAWVDPRSLAGVSSRGAALSAALYSAAPYVKSLIADGMSTSAAMSRGGKVFEMNAASQVIDAGRVASSMDTFTRRGVAYTRMVNPGACSRCVVLAGRVYRNNEGFLRHPRCKCLHVATSTDAAKREGLVSDPYEYFESLSESEQDQTFTKAGAQAIRDGSDLFQVVNSRRGMTTAGFTTEGTTRRGYFAGISGGDFQKVAGSRYKRSTVRRLTPDAIYAQNLPRERTLNLLRDNGYLLRQGQVPEGAIRGLGSALTTPGQLTAAQQRVQTARLQWEAVHRGDNPSGNGPLTPQDKATAEKNYRRWLLSGGEIFTR